MNTRAIRKRAFAELREQRRLERHAKRFPPRVWNGGEVPKSPATEAKAFRREQNYYRRRKGWELRRDPWLGDHGLFMLLSRCKSKYWGPGFGPGAYRLSRDIFKAAERNARKAQFRAYQNRG